MIDPSTSTKCYCSLLKILVNDKKILCIPPIFHNNKYSAGFKEKSKIFNTFFTEKCSLIPKINVLPSKLILLTDNSLANCHFSKKDILRIIRKLRSNKAHGHDMISIHLLKRYGDSVLKRLEIIFLTCLRNARFALEWKKASVVPVHKKDDKKLSKPIVQFHFYLSVGKYLNAYFMTLWINFLKNNLLSPSQSGFRPGDSCMDQLHTINHEILSAFDMGLKVCGIFLDISQAFDKVWQDGLIFKLRQNGICGAMINILIRTS